MSQIQIYPYLRAAPDCITGGVWQELHNDGMRPLEDLLPHWDPVVPLHLVRSLTVDHAGIREDCRPGHQDRLRLIAIWYSSGTGMRGHGNPVDLDPDEPTRSVELRLHVDGALLSDRIRIETHLVLAGKGTGTHRLTPQRAGSLLWNDARTVLLAGDSSRFPMESLNFDVNASWLPGDAGWYLDWDPADLQQPALGRIRLLINAGHATVAKAVTGTDPADRVIQDVIRFDTGRTMIMGVLESDEFVQNPGAYLDGSVGAALRRLIQVLFPGYTMLGLPAIPTTAAI